VIPAVDLIEIDVIGAEAPQAVVDLAHGRLARQAAVGSRSHPPTDFGRDYDLVPAGKIPDRPAEDLLTAAERIPVCRVKEIDAGFESPLNEGAAFLLG
jgi:hypothetical protein